MGNGVGGEGEGSGKHAGGARLECTTLDSRIGRGAFNDRGID
ncbi:hypothetical protein [Pectobacterium carotovorum]|nr:hypothetical protein [Pectobacterium carotovorum]